jgi:CheY-like chemotaxis protein
MNAHSSSTNDAHKARTAKLSSTMTMASPRDETFDSLANVPLCMVALDEEGRAVQINETCQAHFGPLFKYSAEPFSSLATDSAEHRAKLEETLKEARLSTAGASNGVPASKKRAADSDEEQAAGGQPIKICREQPITPVPLPVQNIPSSGLGSTDPPSILVVEDTAMCAKLLCMILRKTGCSTTWVENGQMAVDLLRDSVPGMYSLILMDLRMPVMDGLCATAIIKKELKITIPVIALTGDTSADVKSQCKEIGFTEYCNKPMKKDQLLGIIEKYTGYRAGRSGQEKTVGGPVAPVPVTA